MHQAAKFLVALAGAVTQIIGQGLIDGDAAQWLSIIAGVLTAIAVYMVPNAKPSTT